MSGLAGWFCLRVPHELQSKMSEVGLQSSEGLTGLESLFPIWLPHMASEASVSGRSGLSLWLLQCPGDIMAGFLQSE